MFQLRIGADEAIAAMENLRKEAEQARTEPASETPDGERKQ